MQMQMIEQMDWSTRRVLVNDTSAISTLRCLKLYLERLGCNFLDPDSVQLLAGVRLLYSTPAQPLTHGSACTIAWGWQGGRTVSRADFPVTEICTCITCI